MQIEREEYLANLKEQVNSSYPNSQSKSNFNSEPQSQSNFNSEPHSKPKPKKDKANGYYGRAFNNLSKNSMLINIPRTRSGTLSLNSLELLKINRNKLDEI